MGYPHDELETPIHGPKAWGGRPWGIQMEFTPHLEMPSRNDHPVT